MIKTLTSRRATSAKNQIKKLLTNNPYGGRYADKLVDAIDILKNESSTIVKFNSDNTSINPYLELESRLGKLKFAIVYYLGHSIDQCSSYTHSVMVRVDPRI